MGHIWDVMGCYGPFMGCYGMLWGSKWDVIGC